MLKNTACIYLGGISWMQSQNFCWQKEDTFTHWAGIDDVQKGRKWKIWLLRWNRERRFGHQTHKDEAVHLHSQELSTCTG